MNREILNRVIMEQLPRLPVGAADRVSKRLLEVVAQELLKGRAVSIRGVGRLQAVTVQGGADPAQQEGASAQGHAHGQGGCPVEGADLCDEAGTGEGTMTRRVLRFRASRAFTKRLQESAQENDQESVQRAAQGEAEETCTP